MSAAEKEKVLQAVNGRVAEKVFVMCAMATVLLAAETARTFFPWL